MSALNPQSVARALGGDVSGGKVTAPGPGHSRADRSLSVKIDAAAPDGFIVHSHAGDDPIRCKDYVRERMDLPPFRPIPKNSGAAEYVYRDEQGRPYIRVSRSATKRFYQHHWDGSAWVKGTKGLRKVPYGLPELMASGDQPVFVVEGEKDADRLALLGLVASTASEGAGKWRPELNKWFAGKTVFVLPDNDAPGRAHAHDVARHLSSVASALRVVALPGLPLAGDVSDWLDAGGDVVALLTLAEAAPIWAANDNEPADPEDDTIDADTLMGMDFAPLNFVIPAYVVEGLTVLGGKPKLGKSWWAYDAAIAVATGGFAMGQVNCEQGDVLYLALEDNRRRMQHRINVVRPLSRKLGGLSRLKVRTRAPRIGDGLIEALEKWRTSVANPRLIIVDVYMKIRPPRKSSEDSYAADYAAVTPLQRFASEHRLAIVLVTHTRKMEAEDPLESISGTNGITGAADAVLVLNLGAKGMTLYGRGRDIEEIESAMKLDGGRWTILGDATTVRRSAERKKILEAIESVGAPTGPIMIAALSGLNYANVRAMLVRMVRAGEVTRSGRGLYGVGHNGNKVTTVVDEAGVVDEEAEKQAHPDVPVTSSQDSIQL
jgi:hypothetical protein